MDIEKFASFFGEDRKTNWEGDNAYQGLQIISRYIDPGKKNLITGASHDVMYSVDAEELIEAGITEEDLEALGRLNWTYDEESAGLQCFV